MVRGASDSMTDGHRCSESGGTESGRPLSVESLGRGIIKHNIRKKIVSSFSPSHGLTRLRSTACKEIREKH